MFKSDAIDNKIMISYNNIPIGFILFIEKLGIYECNVLGTNETKMYCSKEEGYNWVTDEYCKINGILNIEKFAKEFNKKNSNSYISKNSNNDKRSKK